MGIFDSLNVGYSGLSTSQASIETTSHNIANANTPGYSRQRIEQKANFPIHNRPSDVGSGVRVEEIARVHDEFVYARMKGSSANVAHFEFMEKNMQEIADGFADLDNLGIAQDLKDMYSSWSNLSENPDDQSAKVVTVNRMNSFANNLNSAKSRLTKIQDRLNDEFVQGIDRVNDIAKDIVNLNKSINKVENVKHQNANDLRDQRDQLELELSKLVNISVHKGNMNNSGPALQTDAGNLYNINIAGHNIVDGITFHPLDDSISSNKTKMTSVYITDHDYGKTDITSKIRGGKLGALVALRGDGIDETTGKATHSKIQDYIDSLDTFTKGFTQKANSIYASAAQSNIVTDDLDFIDDDDKLLESEHFKAGKFDLVVYDNNGNQVGKKSITIDETTTLNSGTNSIVSQINANTDDNNDNDATNDIDDLFEASVVSDPNKPHVLRINPKDSNSHYTIAIEDNGTDFGGITGVNKLFEGDSAGDIRVSSNILANPSTLKASKAPIDGNSDLAKAMVDLQYEKIDFKNSNGTQSSQTAEEFYRYATAQISSDAQHASINKDAAVALNKTLTQQMQAVSGVDMDEELMNLMKFQSSYQASAKIITTVDQMLNTLLSIKQ